MRTLALMFACIGIAGCAGIDVQRITDANRETADGVRYWRPAPYLLVSATDKGCTAKITWLPDPSEQYAISARPGLGSASIKPTLVEGWQLTALEATADTAVGSEIIGLISGALGEKSLRGGREVMPLTPGLYPFGVVGNRLVLDVEHPSFTAGQPCSTVVAPGGPPG